MARKERHEEDELEDDDTQEKDEKEDEDDEDTIDLDSAKEEEDDDEDDEDDEDEEEGKYAGKSVEDIERRRLFQTEAEEILEGLTLEDVVEVLKENEMSPKLAPRLKKLLADVIHEGEAEDMDDAWDEAMERLEDV